MVNEMNEKVNSEKIFYLAGISGDKILNVNKADLDRSFILGEIVDDRSNSIFNGSRFCFMKCSNGYKQFIIFPNSENRSTFIRNMMAIQNRKRISFS